MGNLYIIREIAKENKLTLKELAKRVDISEQGLQKIINEGTGKSSTLKKIADELQIPIAILFGEDVPIMKRISSTSSVVNEQENKYNTCPGCLEKIEDIEFYKQQLREKTEYIEMLKAKLKQCEGQINVKSKQA